VEPPGFTTPVEAPDQGIDAVWPRGPSPTGHSCQDMRAMPVVRALRHGAADHLGVQGPLRPLVRRLHPRVRSEAPPVARAAMLPKCREVPLIVRSSEAAISRCGVISWCKASTTVVTSVPVPSWSSCHRGMTACRRALSASSKSHARLGGVSSTGLHDRWMSASSSGCGGRRTPGYRRGLPGP